MRVRRNLLKEVIMTSGLEWLLIVWGIVTGIFLILLFYRSALTRQEDDQLFIDETASSRATEQRQLIAKVNKINPLVKVVGATSGVMILIIAGSRGTSRLFRSMGENTMGLFSFRVTWPRCMQPLRCCQHHRSEIARSRHTKKAPFAQESYL